MGLEERVYSVMIVSAAGNFNSSLQPLLPDCRFSPVRFESSISAARRTLLEQSFDMVVINSPLPDDPGIRFAVDICSTKTGVALLMVRADQYDEIYGKVAGHGVYVLSRPTSRTVVAQAVDWMAATRERLKKLEKKTVSIEEKMQEIRLVNRAKWLLIDHRKMTEADAHRYIEKKAMDCCASRREVAEEIIRLYT